MNDEINSTNRNSLDSASSVTATTGDTEMTCSLIGVERKHTTYEFSSDWEQVTYSASDALWSSGSTYKSGAYVRVNGYTAASFICRNDGTTNAPVTIGSATDDVYTTKEARSAIPSSMRKGGLTIIHHCGDASSTHINTLHSAGTTFADSHVSDQYPTDCPGANAIIKEMYIDTQSVVPDVLGDLRFYNCYLTRDGDWIVGLNSDALEFWPARHFTDRGEALEASKETIFRFQRKDFAMYVVLDLTAIPIGESKSFFNVRLSPNVYSLDFNPRIKAHWLMRNSSGSCLAYKTIYDKDIYAATTLDANTIYDIRGTINLHSNVLTIEPGTILRFNGGVLTNGTLHGDGGQIEAPHYQIFEDITFTSDFSNEFEIEWFGASANSSVDSAIAINNAIKAINPSDDEEDKERKVVRLVGHGSRYYVASTIILNKTYVSLDIKGELIAQGNITAIKLTQSFCNIHVRRLFKDGTPHTESESTGLLLAGNAYECKIEIDEIMGFGRGIYLRPRVNEEDGLDYSGIQYCRFNWQRIECYTCITFDVDGKEEGEGLWINENYFHGGRLGGPSEFCKYGIRQIGTGSKFDLINGNVFEQIGFEGLDYAIAGLHRWTNCRLLYLRMAEKIKYRPYIELSQCDALQFDIKGARGLADEGRISKKDCDHIIFYNDYRAVYIKKNKDDVSQVGYDEWLGIK